MSSRPPEPEIYSQFPLEYALKMTSIGCAVAFLRSLYSWAQRVLPMPTLNSLLLITITSRYRHQKPFRLNKYIN